MANLRMINVDLNRQYRNDLNWNFQQIEALTGTSAAEIARVERESKERDNLIAGTDVEAIIDRIDTSADNADVKAVYAETQGDYAKEQGDYAKSQGEFAGIKGEYADEKAMLADVAAANANTEASNLSQLKVDVVDATQSANTAINNLAPYGEYSALTAYVPNNIVTLGGSGYMNILASTDVLPTNETNWKKVVDRGERGLQGLPGIGSGTVSSVNGIEPDSLGNVELVIPDPDLSGLATKVELNTHEEKIASVDELGHMKVGENLTITPDGTLNASGGTVPDASTEVKGIVQLNNTLTSTLTTQAATANVIKQLNDIKANKVQGASINLTFQNGWAPVGDFLCAKDDFGRVFLSGDLRNGTTSSHTLLFTLPVGYRIPLHHNSRFSTLVTSDGTSNSTVQITMYSDGRVMLSNSAKLQLFVEVNFAT